MIPYLGEKSKFSDFITPNIPTDISHFVEPFGGMFGVFLSLEHSKFNCKFIYNDINKLNYNIFNKINEEQFIHRLMDKKVDEIEYYNIQKNWNINEWDDDDFTINWIILLCCSRSRYSILDGEWKSDDDFEIFKSRIKYYQRVISKVDKIHNIDYKDIIEMYDSPTTLFYLDPPYFNKEHFYINHSFDEYSHYELSEVLRNIKGKFILSYYKFPMMLEWYSDCKIINNKGLLGIEYLIMNY